MNEAVNTIEIRAAWNGYVISAFKSRDAYSAVTECKGYATYVVQTNDPDEVGKVVAQVLRDHAITMEVVIPPARPVA